MCLEQSEASASVATAAFTISIARPAYGDGLISQTQWAEGLLCQFKLGDLGLFYSFVPQFLRCAVG